MASNCSCRQQQEHVEHVQEQVRQALEHLYDFPYLQRHPFASELARLEGRPGESPGQCLRRVLVAAIEALNPGPGVPFRNPQARVYNAMLLRYIEGMTVIEAAHELGISRRQAHRDLQRGQEAVASMLLARREGRVSQGGDGTGLSSIEEEIARLEVQPRPVDVGTLVQGALDLVQHVAERQGIELGVDLPPRPVIVATDPTMARQVLVNALSQALRLARPPELKAVLTVAEREVAVAFRFQRRADSTGTPSLPDAVERLGRRLGWRVAVEVGEQGASSVTVRMGGLQPAVQVIDDNEGLVQLLSDYLTAHACRVVTATCGRQGLDQAAGLLPDAIVLDIMMPDMDGWEFLQRLRANPKTAGIPVVICSVIDNPDLAYSLGATLFLPKPVSREGILGALRQLGVV